jgi:hypothetical protein
MSVGVACAVNNTTVDRQPGDSPCAGVVQGTDDVLFGSFPISSVSPVVRLVAHHHMHTHVGAIPSGMACALPGADAPFGEELCRGPGFAARDGGG